jgi:hypothetical protein
LPIRSIRASSSCRPAMVRTPLRRARSGPGRQTGQARAPADLLAQMQDPQLGQPADRVALLARGVLGLRRLAVGLGLLRLAGGPRLLAGQDGLGRRRLGGLGRRLGLTRADGGGPGGPQRGQVAAEDPRGSALHGDQGLAQQLDAALEGRVGGQLEGDAGAALREQGRHLAALLRDLARALAEDRGDDLVVEAAEPDRQRPAEDRRQHALQVGGQQQEVDPGPRLLDRLQQRVAGALAEGVGRVDDHDVRRTLVGRVRLTHVAGAGAVDGDRAGLAVGHQPVDVRVVADEDPMTGRTRAAAAAGLLPAQQGAGEAAGEGRLADAARTDQHEGVVQLPASERPRQRGLGLVMAAHAREARRRGPTGAGPRGPGAMARARSRGRSLGAAGRAEQAGTARAGWCRLRLAAVRTRHGKQTRALRPTQAGHLQHPQRRGRGGLRSRPGDRADARRSGGQHPQVGARPQAGDRRPEDARAQARAAAQGRGQLDRARRGSRQPRRRHARPAPPCSARVELSAEVQANDESLGPAAQAGRGAAPRHHHHQEQAQGPEPAPRQPDGPGPRGQAERRLEHPRRRRRGRPHERHRGQDRQARGPQRGRRREHGRQGPGGRPSTPGSPSSRTAADLSTTPSRPSRPRCAPSSSKRARSSPCAARKAARAARGRAQSRAPIRLR